MLWLDLAWPIQFVMHIDYVLKNKNFIDSWSICLDPVVERYQ